MAVTGFWTNRGVYLMLDTWLVGATPPTGFKAHLVTDAVVATVDTNTLSELTQVVTGNGYLTAGLDVERSATGFTTLTEDDTNDLASAVIKDTEWTASGGPIPASGSGARQIVFTTDEVTLGDRQIMAVIDLGSAKTVSDGQIIGQRNSELRSITV